MTLKEAHESGRNYRQVGSKGDFYQLDGGDILDLQDVLADCQLEPIPDKTVTINKRDFLAALKASGIHPTYVHSYSLLGWVQDLIDELGLED